jgi:hypothetical protein
MTELEIQAQLEAQQKADADAKAEAEAQDADNTGDKPVGSDIDNKIDYEAELKREREAREKAEKAAADNAFKLREEKRKREEFSYEDNTQEEKPLTAADLQEMLEKQNQTFEKRLNETKVSEFANRVASSKAEADLIVEVFNNRQFPTHFSIEEQMNEAYAIANAKRLVAENNELKRALSNKDGVSRGFATTHSDAMPSSEPKLESDVKAELSAQGFGFNGATRRWEKKISNSKVLVYDLKTKKIVVA